MEREHADINAAFAEIELARSHLSATGAFDAEGGQLSVIESELRSGKITPEQAIISVRNILASRNDYH